MTAVKQIAITSANHLKSLRGYLDRSNERHEVADMDSQHLNDPANWEREFDRTREAYGHNRAGRAGAKCTYCYHQIIAFNPSECDLNGGRLTAGDCMAFAREWVERYYPNQEAVWALHREHCAADGTDRWAVHVAINRTDLETGKRLDEGRSSRQKVLHASRMRGMDERWGLAQMEKGARNSAHHARQQSRGERRARVVDVEPRGGPRPIAALRDRPRSREASGPRERREGGQGRRAEQNAGAQRGARSPRRPHEDESGQILKEAGHRLRVQADLRPQRREREESRGRKDKRAQAGQGLQHERYIARPRRASCPRDQEGGREGGLSGHRRGDGGGPLRAGKRDAIHGLETAGPLGVLPFDHIRRLIEKESCPLPPCHSFCCPPGHPRRH